MRVMIKYETPQIFHWVCHHDVGDTSPMMGNICRYIAMLFIIHFPFPLTPKLANLEIVDTQRRQYVHIYSLLPNWEETLDSLLTFIPGCYFMHFAGSLIEG
jgi:hypothetical protein